MGEVMSTSADKLFDKLSELVSVATPLVKAAVEKELGKAALPGATADYLTCVIMCKDGCSARFFGHIGNELQVSAGDHPEEVIRWLKTMPEYNTSIKFGDTWYVLCQRQPNDVAYALPDFAPVNPKATEKPAKKKQAPVEDDMPDFLK